MLAMADPVAAARNFLNEERGAGKGGPTVVGDSREGMEEGGRTETVEVRTCSTRPKDTVGA